MKNSNEKTKECCKECKKLIVHDSQFIDGLCACECHKPSVEVSRCCRAKRGGYDPETGSLNTDCSHCKEPFIPDIEPSLSDIPENPNLTVDKKEVYSSEELEDEFIGFWDSKKESLGLGSYSSDVTSWWLEKLKQQKEGTVKEIEVYLNKKDFPDYLPRLYFEELLTIINSN